MLQEIFLWNRKEVNKRKICRKIEEIDFHQKKYLVCRGFSWKQEEKSECEKFECLHRYHYHNSKIYVLCFFYLISSIGIHTTHTPTLIFDWNSANLNESTCKQHFKVSTLLLWMVDEWRIFEWCPVHVWNVILNFHSFRRFNDFCISIINTFWVTTHNSQLLNIHILSRMKWA